MPTGKTTRWAAMIPTARVKGLPRLLSHHTGKVFLSQMDQNRSLRCHQYGAGNVIGGGDWAEDRIVPDCIRSLVNGETIKIRNPSAVRPWQFVLDPLFGYLWLAFKMKEHPEEYPGAWNFGPYYSNNVDVRTLTEKIVQQWGAGTWEQTSQMNNLHEAGSLKLDIAKSVTRLGWKPVYGIEEAIHKTVEWYKCDYSKSIDMYTFSLGQITDFMTTISMEKFNQIHI